MRVDLHIDRIVLDGVDVAAGDRRRLQIAIETQLAHLIATGGLHRELASGVALPRVRAAGITLERTATPQRLGASIAASIYGGIGRPRR